ncbi:lytic transglycosylase domain-containing protein [Pseudoxanthomonas sp. GM95]|uniref:lytic transglycosylase domain-containing protein n=1 Tax=Pseudoxanthomonas sp. GM95 TaxID=1881043 RepID=UPI0015877FB4|nr:lytic transglycosylase domain-containing protein [Pseudoxanthomonas sp. GM95]
MDMMQCQNLAVPMDVMHHIVQVESSANPYAIGVVGGRLVRQPSSLAEAVATAEMLESRGYNFSVGLAQVNRYNLSKYGVTTYTQAFDGCTNLSAGSRILSECHARARGDWGSAFSCYYSGNFTTGYQHGYVQKIFSSMAGQQSSYVASSAIPLSVAVQASRRAPVAPELNSASRRIVSSNAQHELSISAVSAAEKIFAAAEPSDAEQNVAFPQVANAAPSKLGSMAETEGVVRLTRNGPIFPASSASEQKKTRPNISRPSSSVEISQGTDSGSAPAITQAGDNAFVF